MAGLLCYPQLLNPPCRGSQQNHPNTGSSCPTRCWTNQRIINHSTKIMGVTSFTFEGCKVYLSHMSLKVLMSPSLELRNACSSSKRKGQVTWDERKGRTEPGAVCLRACVSRAGWRCLLIHFAKRLVLKTHSWLQSHLLQRCT